MMGSGICVSSLGILPLVHNMSLVVEVDRCRNFRKCLLTLFSLNKPFWEASYKTKVIFKKKKGE